MLRSRWEGYRRKSDTKTSAQQLATRVRVSVRLAEWPWCDTSALNVATQSKRLQEREYNRDQPESDPHSEEGPQGRPADERT